MVVTTEIGDGSNILFWKDRWLGGQRIADLDPNLFAMVPKRLVQKRTVAEDVENFAWTSDIRGEASWSVIVSVLNLAVILKDFVRQLGVADRHFWKLSGSGQYSAKSAYSAFFEGSVLFSLGDRIWKSWAPPKCKFFMWLAAHNKCWTADKLAKRNLLHPACCLFCDQEQETINHLLVSCVFTRQAWFTLLQQVGLSSVAPQSSEVSFDHWWSRALDSVASLLHKGLNSLIILGAWTLWRHRNDCVCNGRSPSLSTVLALVDDEAQLWELAGAKNLRQMMIGTS